MTRGAAESKGVIDDLPKKRRRLQLSLRTSLGISNLWWAALCSALLHADSQVHSCFAALSKHHSRGIARAPRFRRALVQSSARAFETGRMSNGDAQERADELEALSAIFCDDFRLLGEDTFELAVKMADGHELVLYAALPASYPSETVPVYDLRAEWLHPVDEEALHAGLESIWSEGAGEVVVFKWAEWLRDEAPSLLTHAALPPPDAASALAAMALEEEEAAAACASDAALAALSDSGLEQVALSAVHEAHADLHGAVRTGPASPELISRWEQAIRHGEPFTDRKSTFQAHLAPVESLADVDSMLRVLKSNNKVARATHNIMAFRVTTENGTAHSDCDDDGESAAGGRLLHLLDIIGAHNVCVVVSRWYGGIQLGPDRFKHINNVARQLLAQHGHAGGDASSAKGGKGAKKGK